MASSHAQADYNIGIQQISRGSSMRTDIAQTIHRQDYRPYPYRLPTVRLEFDLDAKTTHVTTELHFEPASTEDAPLVLQGEDLELIEVQLNGRVLKAGEFHLDEETLQIHSPELRKPFRLDIVNLCHPALNTKLMGLYVSGDQLFTQCEAQGFRRITWFPDRPDVMSRYEVVLRGDPKIYPLMLSNGNLIEQTALGDGRAQALWQDPHPKPCYLFALVAGDFDCLEQTEVTRSGRTVLLQVYSARGYREQPPWALGCLVRALHWDERRFGLELDLDRFMIVAARDFNMGAMENKGLNVFNAAYVLADPATATDATYRRIESVIGHEYFHNWTGDRVTCRDWFQISLKEGLTVFREQEFSADMLAEGLPEHEAASARAVKRIEDVHTLRVAQFPEDAGPMAHPIRPDSYQEIANFYTPTVYEKGAEVIRMQHTLLGEAGFRAGMDEYFRRHDGQAVTCDDFVAAMESVYKARHPGHDFAVFRRWYSQAGTPRVKVQSHYDAQTQRLHITLSQHCAPVGLETRQAPSVAKPPLHIPFAIGLLDESGQALPIHWGGEAPETVVLELKEATQSWTLESIAKRPILSLARGFSAPVIVQAERSDQDLASLARHDTDPFARWDATQEVAHRYLTAGMHAHRNNMALPDAKALISVWRAAIDDTTLSPAYKAQLLSLPAQREVMERNEPLGPQAVVAVWRHAQQALGAGLAMQWQQVYESLADGDAPYSPDPVASGRRSLRNLALDYLLATQAPQAAEQARTQYRQARNMTESLGALTTLLDHARPYCADLVQDFHDRWQADPLVLDRWFGAQASAASSTVADVRKLMALPDFILRNPNRARSVIFRFCMENHAALHTPQGYDFWAEQVLALDQINPEVASRLSRAFDNWARHEPTARAGMQAALKRVLEHPGLSRNVHEIVSKALGA